MEKPTIDINHLMILVNTADKKCPICEKPMVEAEEFIMILGVWIFFDGMRCPERHLLLGTFTDVEKMPQ